MGDLFETRPEILEVSSVFEAFTQMGIGVLATDNGDWLRFIDEDGGLILTWWRAQDIGRALGLPDRDTRRICAELFKADCGLAFKMYRGDSEYAGTWWLDELAMVPFISMARDFKNKRQNHMQSRGHRSPHSHQ